MRETKMRRDEIVLSICQACLDDSGDGEEIDSSQNSISQTRETEKKKIQPTWTRRWRQMAWQVNVVEKNQGDGEKHRADEADDRGKKDERARLIQEDRDRGHCR